MKDVVSIIEDVKKKNPGEKEFHQAVEEVLLSLKPFIEKNPRYMQYKILERIVEPERVIMFRVPWVDDKGEIQVNRGFRIEMNSALGPYKGGLRFHPSVNLGILKFLAFEQIFKNSLTTLPIGGGKGGSDFDPKNKSDYEVMRFCHSFMNELYRHLGENTDVPAGDIGVGAREIGYMFGQFKKLKNTFECVLTGKTVGWGGSHIRPEATGYGAVFFAENMLKVRNTSLEGKVVTVSGSGNVAQYTAEKVMALGGKVVTFSDSNGYIYDKEGVTKEKLAFLIELKNVKRGRIKEYADKFRCEYVEGKRPWAVPCQVAFPSATENEIDGSDAKSLVKNGCMCVSEGANMPSNLDAVKVFLDAKICYGPGKAANAGGVATSGFEMSQNSMRLQWSREEVENKLRELMGNIHEQCVRYGKQGGDFVNYVDGANISGFVRVSEAMIAQGVV